MIYNTEIIIDEAIIPVVIDFEYYREDSEDIVIVDSINNGSMEILPLITPAELENIKVDCADIYKHRAFKYWEENFSNL